MSLPISNHNLFILGCSQYICEGRDISNSLIKLQIEILKTQIAQFEDTLNNLSSWNPTRIYRRVKEVQSIVDTSKALLSLVKKEKFEE